MFSYSSPAWDVLRVEQLEILGYADFPTDESGTFRCNASDYQLKHDGRRPVTVFQHGRQRPGRYYISGSRAIGDEVILSLTCAPT